VTDKISTCIWYDFNQALPAAQFYMSLGLADSHIERVITTPSDNPSTKAGDDLLVEFVLAGRAYCGLNGGPRFPQTEAVSLMIVTEDQAETDRLWNQIIDNGGQASACGWCKDRWGVNWQITPRRMLELLADPDPDRAKAAFDAMGNMTLIKIADLEAALSALSPAA